MKEGAQGFFTSCTVVAAHEETPSIEGSQHLEGGVAALGPLNERPNDVFSLIQPVQHTAVDAERLIHQRRNTHTKHKDTKTHLQKPRTAQRQPQVPSNSASRNSTNMPIASPDASEAGGPTTSCTSVLLSTSVILEKEVALNSSGEKVICAKIEGVLFFLSYNSGWRIQARSAGQVKSSSVTTKK